MDTALKQRLWGAGVLASLAIIFLPMLLKGPDVRAPDAADVPLTMPAAPDQQFETRQLPLILPEATATRDSVLGMPSAPTSTPAPAATPEAASTVPTPDTVTPPPPEASVSANPATPAATPAPAPAPVAAVPAPEKAKPKTPAVAEKTVAEKPVAEKPVADAKVAAGNYVVNVGSFSNLDNAKSLVARLRAAKLPVTTDSVKLGAASAMRIRVGPYSDRATAEAARLRADGAVGGSSKVIALDASIPTEAAVPATAKPAAAPTVTGKSNPAKSPAAVGFAVQLAAPAAEADAVALRDHARSLGFDSFIQRVETEAGARFRVRVGPVADRDLAASLRESVSSKLGVNGIVVANP